MGSGGSIISARDEMNRKPKVLLVMGPNYPGREKHCLYIEQFYQFKYISLNELIENELTKKSEQGKIIENLRKEKKILPSEMVVGMIFSAINNSKYYGINRFLIEGFPDNLENFEGWNEKISENVDLLGCLYFHITQECFDLSISKLDENTKNNYINGFKIFSQKTITVLEKFTNENKVYTIDSKLQLDKLQDLFYDIFINQLELIPGSVPHILFVLGGPGCGKGTQCAHLVNTYGYVHLSAGDCLREEIASGSPDGNMISEHIKNGTIVPVEVTISLLKKKIIRNCIQGNTKYLIDGFPRNMNNYEGWNKIMSDHVYFDGCLYFDCSEETMTRRILERSKTSGRTDDNIESIKKRFITYKEETQPIINLFDVEKKLYKIDAEKSIDIVSNEVNNIMNNTLYAIPGPRPVVIFCTGPPGSGKSTISTYITEKFHFTNISVGKLLKESVNNDPNISKDIKEAIDSGKLVKSAIVIDVILKEIIRLSQDHKTAFIIEGYPRSLDNIQSWERKVQDNIFVHGLLNLNCPKELTLSRLKDVKEDIKKIRYEEYNNHINEIQTYYNNCKSLYNVDTSLSMAEVHKQVDRIFMESLLEFPGEHPSVLFVIGGPGSGRSTQCQYLSKNNPKIGYISSGDILRNHITKNGQHKDEIKKYMDQGSLIPNTIMIQLIRKEMIDQVLLKKSIFIMDGYPGTIDNLNYFLTNLKYTITVVGCVYFNCNDDNMMKRSLARKRVDDTEKIITNRINEFKKNSPPIINYFKNNGTLFEYDANKKAEELNKEVDMLLTTQLSGSIGQKPKKRISL